MISKLIQWLGWELAVEMVFLPSSLKYRRSHWHLGFYAFGRQNKHKGWKLGLLVPCLAPRWEMILPSVCSEIFQSLITFMPYSHETWRHEEMAVPCFPQWHFFWDSIQHFRELVRSSFLPWESCSFLMSRQASFRPDFPLKPFGMIFFCSRECSTVFVL